MWISKKEYDVEHGQLTKYGLTDEEIQGYFELYGVEVEDEIRELIILN
jgi:hypothetical protein